MAIPRVIVTKDGSHSLVNDEINETYHSVHGALAESRHVFIEMGLAFYKNANNGDVAIFEVGFGTGLNTLLALEFSTKTNTRIHYRTIERFPLEEETYSQLNYGKQVLGPDEFFQLHRLPWNDTHPLTSRFTFTKQHQALQNTEILPNSFDLVFFDAFAPSKQPEMWELPLLRKVVASMRPNGVFVTYCAKGQLKRDLRSLGLEVQTLPGPPGKKEMIRAIR